MEQPQAEFIQSNPKLNTYSSHIQYHLHPSQPSLLSLKLNLEHKYLLPFNFFLSKPINQIAYELKKRPITQHFLDSRIHSDPNEYLKRHYHLTTEQGHPQIPQRLQMLGEFYALQQPNINFYYPMMILTDTKSIFQKRQRRFKKICAGEGSSDQTESKSQIYCYSFDTSHFLKDLSTISLTKYDDRQEKNDISFDSDVHDVYVPGQSLARSLNFGMKDSSFILSQENSFNLKTNVDHLICDFQKSDSQILNQETINNSKILSQQTLELEKQTKKPLRALNQTNFPQPKSSSLDKNDGNLIKKTNYLSSYLNLFENKYRKLYFNGQSSLLGSTDVKTKSENQNTDTYLGKIDGLLEKQKQEKLKNRKKIREKAEELLRRVRTSSQVE